MNETQTNKGIKMTSHTEARNQNEVARAARKASRQPRKLSAAQAEKQAADRAAQVAYRATLKFEILLEAEYRGQTGIAGGGRYATLEQAEAMMANYPLGRNEAGVTYKRIWIVAL
jgi:hypothetical protein